MTTNLDDTGIRRRQDGSIDTGFYVERGLTLRASAASEQGSGLLARFAAMIASLFAARRLPGISG